MKTKSQKVKNVKKEIALLDKNELSKLKGGINSRQAYDYEGGTLDEVVCTPEKK